MTTKKQDLKIPRERLGYLGKVGNTRSCNFDSICGRCEAEIAIFGNMVAQASLEASPVARSAHFRYAVPRGLRCVRQARGRQSVHVQAGTIVRFP